MASVAKKICYFHLVQIATAFFYIAAVELRHFFKMCANAALPRLYHNCITSSFRHTCTVLIVFLLFQFAFIGRLSKVAILCIENTRSLKVNIVTLWMCG